MVNVCPTEPFSDIALVSQEVGIPALVEDADAGLELEVLPPPILSLALSFLSFEHPAMLKTSAVKKSTAKSFRGLYEAVMGNVSFP
jgi:hypothetical protein